MPDAPQGPQGAPDLLPARMLNEFVYCPRLFHLMWPQDEWAESADTVEGRREHRRVDQETGEVPPPEAVIDGPGFTARSVLLSSEEDRLIARIDLLEGADGEVVPVDYKRGQAPETPPWDTDRIQIGAQALILLAKGYRCRRAMVWYSGSRRRVEIPVDDSLLTDVRAARDAALATAASPTAPPPLIDSPKCPRCSLVGICLPDEYNHLTGRADPSPEDVRRLYAARPDALPVYVQAHGATVGKRGEELNIWERERGRTAVRLLDVSLLSVFGNVTVTADALAALSSRNIPICHFSYGGWFRAVTHSVGSRNCALRIPQYRVAADSEACLRLARGFVERKILNSRTLLRRNADSPSPGTLASLARMAEQASSAPDLATLLGIEGMAARTYFSSFDRVLKTQADAARQFRFDQRNRRPPRDPVNALLSLAYSVLARDWTVTLFAVGLDPFLGFLHQPRFGRAPLALDLMEEFRPLIADSVVIQVINNGEVRPEDFVIRGNAVNLTEKGRKKFFLAYERRMAHLVRHPIFRYRVSYRQVLELQARLLGRSLTGEIEDYPGFRTR